MSNEFYNQSGSPSTGATGSSATMRSEFSAIAAGFALLPTMSGNGARPLFVNAGETALEATAVSTARIRLGLGSIATQDANNVTISGGTVKGVSALTTNNAVITGGSVSGASLGSNNVAITGGSISGASLSSNNVTITGGSITGTTVTLTGPYTASGLTMNTARLLGRTTASSGAAEEISASTPLSLTGGALTFSNQSANAVLAGPASGAAAAPTFRSLGGAESSMVLLGSKTASASASISFAHLGGTGDVLFDWTLYDEYEFHFVQILPSNNNIFWQAQISEDNGTTYKAGAGAYNTLQVESVPTPTVTATTSGAVTAFVLNNLGVGNATEYGINGKLIVNKPTTVMKKSIRWEFSFESPTSALTQNYGNGIYSADTAAWTGIKFFFSAGTITSGTIYAYGIRRA